MSKSNNATVMTRDKKVIAGVDKYFGNVASVTLLGKAYTPTELKALFQGEIDAETQLDALRSQLKQVVVTIRPTRAHVRAVFQALRVYILGTAGPTAVQMLEDFAISTKHKSTPDTGAKAQAVVQAKATRAARHTAGPKQKKAITAATPASPNPPKA